METTTQDGTRNNRWVVKVVLIGDASVGKSSLAVQLCLKRFYEDHVPTIGGSFYQRVLVAPPDPHSPPRDVRLDLWDTAGTLILIINNISVLNNR